jgi:starch synthase (maltosyl-transferring)
MQHQTRIIIQNVYPQIDSGIYFIKRVVGQYLTVSADVFADGHDVIRCCVNYRHESDKEWQQAMMTHLSNDSWEATFRLDKQGYYTYFIEGWVDYALNWQHGTGRKIADGQQIKSELLEGALYLREIMAEVSPAEREWLEKAATAFTNDNQYDAAILTAQSEQLSALFSKYPRKFLSNKSSELRVYVDRKKALFSTWYEFFPRSASRKIGKHGRFKDCEALLPGIAAMGFDTLYFPPIHPIGEVNRKGKNNATASEPGDPGSPWGIGSQHGGHMSLHPDLGSEADFKSLIKAAQDLGIEIAMDYALQAAPDHPWVQQHPQWFKWRPDGTVQYAENPPKKYQDILPIYFETDDWKNLWDELLKVALYWIEEFGIRIFRVDNPHTKPFYFWGWLISKIKEKHPDVLFLSEAFTRPKVMNELAKQGFTQSYTYFTWRNTKQELTDYVTELTQSLQKEYYRPNFWPNTPDINPWSLQSGNEAIHLQRYFLAATLSSNVGIYGPHFEQMISAALPGKEEYMDSEKYDFFHWDWEHKNKLTLIMSKINQLRKENTSLQQTNNIVFCETDNDQLLGYYKFADDKTNQTLMVVSLDPYYPRQGMVRLPLENLGQGPFKVFDQITGNSYIWDKEWNFVELHPALPFHLFTILKS